MATITLDRLTTTVISEKKDGVTNYYLSVQFQDSSRSTLAPITVKVLLGGTTQAKIQQGLNEAQNEAISQFKPIINQYEKLASVDTILTSLGAKAQTNVYTGAIADYVKV